MVNNMIPTAQEARDTMPTEGELIKSSILKAAQNGHILAYVNFQISEAAEKYLRELGYFVEVFGWDADNGYLSRISWGTQAGGRYPK